MSAPLVLQVVGVMNCMPLLPEGKIEKAFFKTIRKKHTSEPYDRSQDDKVASKIILSFMKEKITSFASSNLVEADETKPNKLLKNIRKSNDELSPRERC